MAGAQCLVHRFACAANEILRLLLDPEVRRVIGEIRQHRDHWHTGKRGVEALVESSVEVRNQRNEQARLTLLPEWGQQPDLCVVIQPDNGVHRRQQVRRAERPSLCQNQIINVFETEARCLAKDVERVEHFLQVYQPHIPSAILRIDDCL